MSKKLCTPSLKYIFLLTHFSLLGKEEPALYSRAMHHNKIGRAWAPAFLLKYCWRTIVKEGGRQAGTISDASLRQSL